MFNFLVNTVKLAHREKRRLIDNMLPREFSYCPPNNEVQSAYYLPRDANVCTESGH